MKNVRTVLLVEDDQVLRKLVGKELARNGYEILEAGNGLDGLALFERHTPNAVVTDLAMPGLNGLELMMKVREKDPLVPILLFSGHLTDSTILELLRFDRFAALHKPCSGQQVLAAVEYVCSFPVPEKPEFSPAAFRFDLEIPVNVGNFAGAKSYNISTSGMFLVTERAASIGEPVMLTFDLPAPIQILGEVVWCRSKSEDAKGPNGVGVRFLEMSKEAKSSLENLLISEFRRLDGRWLELFRTGSPC